MGHMNREGQIWLGYNVVSYCHTARSILSYLIPCRPALFCLAVRRATPPNREPISFRFATPFIPCTRPPNRSPSYHIVLSRPVPFHPLPSPPIIPFTSLSLTVSFYLFPSLPIPSHLATSVSLPFNTSPYLFIPLPCPFHTLSIPSHTLSIPPRPLPSFRIFAHPVTPHSVIFLFIAPLPVFFANPLLFFFKIKGLLLLVSVG